MKRLTAEPLTPAAFAPFGAVIALRAAPDQIINDGYCARHHALSTLDIDAPAGISLFDASPRSLPYRFALLERHPRGAQAFLPLTPTSFLVITAPDIGGTPGTPRAFLTQPGQSIQLHRNSWHGVLTPLVAPGQFAVIDYVGKANNLEEYHHPEGWEVQAPPS